jgi:hypothetical protein
MDNQEASGDYIGSQEAREEGLAYEMVSGVVNLDAGEGNDTVSPSRNDKPDMGREPEYYAEEHSGGNPSGGPGGKAMDPGTKQAGDQP